MKKNTKDKNCQIEPENPFGETSKPQDEEPKPDLGNEIDEIKAKIESILYCVPEGVNIDVLANKLNLGFKADILKILKEMQAEYNKRKGGIKLIQEGDKWKFSIPSEYTNLILDAALPEFDKAVLETLAYIGWRGGSRQCDVVRVRSNKAYNHIKLLIEKGFIESSKSGLSKWLQPTRKFYEYFNIEPKQKLPVPKEIEEKLEKAQNSSVNKVNEKNQNSESTA
jgi:segregation and condensation protein B